MNFYQSLGFLVFGSRLKRLSELFLSEINNVYKAEGLAFETTWFPIFFLLSENTTLSIKELGEHIEISHPATSQLIANLKNKGLVQTNTSNKDARKQLVKLTAEGKELLKHVMPVWEAIRLTMEEVAENAPESKQILNSLTALETTFKSVNVAELISEKLHNKPICAPHD
jgi:DNA-binding MarR family transcriptional regulator